MPADERTPTRLVRTSSRGPRTSVANPLLPPQPAPRNRIKTSDIPEGPFRQTADVVLGTGERLFDFASAMSYTSSLFERETPKPK